MTTKQKLKPITILSDHALVPLTRGLAAKISLGDVAMIDQRNWHASGSARPAVVSFDYFGKGTTRKLVTMSHLICPPAPGQVVDHINGDPMDNRRENLRACSQSENVQNIRWNPRNTTGVRGVYYAVERKKFVATIGVRRKLIRIGGYDTIEEATAARKAAEARYFTPVQPSAS